MNDRQKALDKLNELNISYEVIEHKAAFKVEEMDDLEIKNKEDIVKNLFLRDTKGSRHFLVVLEKDKKADLKELRRQLGSSALSFASQQRLEKYLMLSKGSVSPLGIINDTACAVEVVFDLDLTTKEILGIHPNDNTATILLSFMDLKKVIELNGNPIHYVTV